MDQSTTSNHHQRLESDSSPIKSEDPFRRSSTLSDNAHIAPTTTTGLLSSSSLIAQVGNYNHNQPKPTQGNSPSSRFALQGSHTFDDLNSSPSSINDDSRSILGILNPRSNSKSSTSNQDYGISIRRLINDDEGEEEEEEDEDDDDEQEDCRIRSSSTHVPSIPSPGSISQATISAPVAADGPPQSIMIDIEGSSNNYRFQSSSNQLFKQHQDGDDEVLENSEDDSSSPSPSLIRHQQHSSTNPRQVTQIVPSERSSSNNPSSLNPLRLSKRTFDPSNSMAKSLLQDHRRSTTLTTDSTINNTSNINNFRGGGGDRPTSILDRVRAAWRQERERYLSIQDRSIGYSPIRLDGPNEVNQTLDENDNSRWPSSGLSSREMAMWRWINVEDLDAFLQEVYGYYKGKGIWAIGLSRLCNLLTVGFVIGFSTFLMGCIDYSILRSSHHLEEVIVPRCVTRFSGLTLILFLGCGGFYLWKVFSFSQEIAKLWQMHEFFTELLEVSEADIQTIPWHGLVDKISSLKHQHPSTTAAAESRTPNLNLQSTQSVLQRKLDAHDVANQIMREKNYLIALFNKDVLDLRPPLPKWMIGNAFIAEKTLTKSLEWNLAYCLRDYLLDGRGQVRPEFLQSELRAHLAAGLRRRFVMMAIINAALAPFLFLYVLMYSFFRYFEEYHKNPSSIGSRSFTRLAQWKFRGYNELSHLFQSRLIRSYSISKRYVDQFPKTKTSILAKFVSFVAGSFAAVLIVLSLFDPDAFLHFEVTRDRSVLFYIGLFGSILAISRGMTPKLYEEQIDSPEVLMQQIVQMTHYLPRHWAGRLHSLEVYNEFGELFQLKMAIFLQELMGVVLTPFTLWQGFSDEKCEKIVDFFREFTVHVEGIGYVCSFAVFDFNRLMGNESSDPSQSSRTNNPLINQTNRQGQSSASPFNQPQPRVQSQDVTKMERSLLNFVAHHPNWEPSNQTASLYLSKAIGYSAADSLFQPAHLQPQQQLPYLHHYPSSLTPMNGPGSLVTAYSASNAGMRSQRGINLGISQLRSRQGIHNSMMGIGGNGGPRGVNGGGAQLTQSSLQPSLKDSLSYKKFNNLGSKGPMRTLTSSPVQRRNPHLSQNHHHQLQNLYKSSNSSSNNNNCLDGRRNVMGVEAIDEESDTLTSVAVVEGIEGGKQKLKGRERQQDLVNEEVIKGERRTQDVEEEDDPFRVIKEK